MTEDEKLRNLSRNLNLLCKSYGSIADVCRRIGINRQQFNKYLGGRHMPSPRIRTLIAAFFSVEEDDLLKNAAAFDALFEGPRFDFSWEMRSSSAFQKFIPFLVGSPEYLSPYYGVYFRYHNSSIYKGRILRSVMMIYEQNSIVQYVCIERFPKLDGTGKLDCMFKYNGIATMIANRIFLADFEDVQRNEVTFSILLPRYRNVLRMLFGTMSGVAATPLREPFSTRMVLDYQGPGPVQKHHLKQATTLLPSDTTIPLDVRAYLTEQKQAIIWGGRA